MWIMCAYHRTDSASQKISRNRLFNDAFWYDDTQIVAFFTQQFFSYHKGRGNERAHKGLYRQLFAAFSPAPHKHRAPRARTHSF